MELQDYLVKHGYIPLDKSWIIRMGILDLINSKKDISRFLDQQKSLGGDLKALKRVVDLWETDKPLEVGESGTMYRFARFYMWKNSIKRPIITEWTLVERSRNMCQNPEIVNWSPEELLKLDNQTSQWATMAYLLGDRRKVENPPYKLKVTYDAVEHWEQQRKEGKSWEARADPTILAQTSAFLRKLSGKELNFNPEQAEDYCFARAFGIIDAKNGEKMFPSLIGHETNRIKEMEKSIDSYKKGSIIQSNDHRVVQALAMLIQTKVHSSQNEVQPGFSNPNCVNKTWPKFWDFLADSENIVKIIPID